MRNFVVAICVAFLTSGCATSVDLEKFRAEAAQIEGIPKDRIVQISRCRILPYEYARTIAKSFAQCGYSQTEERVSIYQIGTASSTAKLIFGIPFNEIQCARYQTKGPLNGVISLFTADRFYQLILSEPSSERVDQTSTSQLLSSLRAHETPLFIDAIEAKISNPLILPIFIPRNRCAEWIAQMPK